MFSPRKRRCFCQPHESRPSTSVFSAQAEVFLPCILIHGRIRCFLRASGGVSKRPFTSEIRTLFSPRKRRCFSYFRHLSVYVYVFSAQAEVFLSRVLLAPLGQRFLRASGGVSSTATERLHLNSFSPRKRRCFSYLFVPLYGGSVFSAQAEVFLKTAQSQPPAMGFLRASGGVSTQLLRLLLAVEFSPRKRRCFLSIYAVTVGVLVFSAQAEVFLTARKIGPPKESFLRASGGVSSNKVEKGVIPSFSPRKRRCF